MDNDIISFNMQCLLNCS